MLIFGVFSSGIAKSSSSFEISPSIFEDRLVQTRFQTVMNVKNTAEGVRTFNIEPGTFFDTPNCEIDYDLDFPPAMSVNPSVVTLEENETAEIAIVGEYDPEILNGFYGGLLITDVTEFEDESDVVFRGRAVSTFRLRGPEPWDINIQPEVSDLIQKGQSEVKYLLKLRNSGKVDVIVGGNVTANFNGELVEASFPETRIYPGLCAFLSTNIDYSDVSQTDGEVSFIANPIVQTFPSDDNRNEIINLENLDFSSSFQFENGAIAGNNYQIELFDVQEVIESSERSLLVQYRVKNIGKLSGSPSVKILVGEPGSAPKTAGRTYSSLLPNITAEGEASFVVNEGVYDITIEVFEGQSRYEQQVKRQTVLGENAAFDNRLLVLILPLIYLIYLVLAQRRKIKELEE